MDLHSAGLDGLGTGVGDLTVDVGEGKGRLIYAGTIDFAGASVVVVIDVDGDITLDLIINGYERD